MRIRTIFCPLILTIMLMMAAAPAAAGPPPQSDEVYVVQSGDTLYSVALRFGVTANDIAAANDLSNPNLIFTGQQLIIPTEQPVAEPAIVIQNNDEKESNDDNQLSSAPPEVYVVQPGDTLNTIASQLKVPVTDIIAANDIQNPDYITVGQQLTIPITGGREAVVSYPAPFAAIELSPAPVLQGQTLLVQVTLSQPAKLSGDFDGRPLFFTGDDSGSWAVIGIHALQETGVYSLALQATLDDGSESATAVNIVVGNGPYATENIQLAPGRESLLDPELVRAEQERMAALWSRLSSRPLWDGTFSQPLATTRITSPFGTRRSYNDGPVSGFHGGTDFGAASGIPIYAPAAGRVVLADELLVRGNAVLIDHGVGVFSGYWHQSNLAVRVGQDVQRGDLIGYVGDTGLVTGAHLHWEMRVGGIAVDPMQWTEMPIP